MFSAVRSLSRSVSTMAVISVALVAVSVDLSRTAQRSDAEDRRDRFRCEVILAFDAFEFTRPGRAN